MKHTLIAFFPSNVSPKSYQNWFLYVEVRTWQICDVKTWFLLENDSVQVCIISEYTYKFKCYMYL